MRCSRHLISEQINLHKEFMMCTSAEYYLPTDLSIISHEPGDAMMITPWVHSNRHLFIKCCKLKFGSRSFSDHCSSGVSALSRVVNRGRVSTWERSQQSEIHAQRGQRSANCELPAGGLQSIAPGCSLKPRQLKSIRHKLESTQNSWYVGNLSNLNLKKRLKRRIFSISRVCSS